MPKYNSDKNGVINLETLVKNIKNILFLGGLLWAIYVEWSRYQETGDIVREMKTDYDAFKKSIQHDSIVYSRKFQKMDTLKNELQQYKSKFDYLDMRTKYDSIDLNTVYSAIRHELKDYEYSGIKFKKTNDGTLFFIKGNLMYNAEFSFTEKKYYYYADDGKTYWCY